MVFENIHNNCSNIFDQKYQHKLTRIEINNKNELYKNYDKINKKLSKGDYNLFYYNIYYDGVRSLH